jgi:hypothetical protein
MFSATVAICTIGDSLTPRASDENGMTHYERGVNGR